MTQYQAFGLYVALYALIFVTFGSVLLRRNEQVLTGDRDAPGPQARAPDLLTPAGMAVVPPCTATT
ncbi:MAG: hypothetical protein GDA35_07555 [Hyphomonadaceae bacterium]|nr:hypothetical protein [Hyphomonadaceae bacterium]